METHSSLSTVVITPSGVYFVIYYIGASLIRRGKDMDEFYGIYYLILSVLYVLLPGIFWLVSKISEASGTNKPTRVQHYQRERRGHLFVSVLLSGIMLSLVPWPLTSYMEKSGIDKTMGLVFVIIFVGVAIFLLWMGIGMFKANSRELKNAQEEERARRADENGGQSPFM
jgi:hypothetical protein